jgi:kynureninase
MSYTFQPGAGYANTLDAADELRSFRDEFVIDDPEQIYLDGNSLGRLPKVTAQRMHDVVDKEWGRRVIHGWNDGWFDAPRRIGEKIAKLLGAREGQVIVCDSTSVNIFKLAVAALQIQGNRDRVVSDKHNFPSDLYILQGAIDLVGGQHELVLIDSRDGMHPNIDQLIEMIDERTALVELSHVTFKSGYLYDMQKITRHARDVGALVLWDLCHSAGVLPVELDASGADMAVGCTYKYLNGGPGAPAFVYVRKRMQSKTEQPIWGWMGQKNPFDFSLQYKPAAGMQRFMTGTPNILSLSAIEPSIEMIQRAGIDRIRAKSTLLTEYLIFLFDQELASRGFKLGTPRDPALRGSHVSIRHADAYRIDRAMIEHMHVVPDFRTPDNIRLGLVPLYTTFAEIFEAVLRITLIVDQKLHEALPKERLAVT